MNQTTIVRPVIYVVFMLALFACGGSRERVKFNTIQDIVIVKKIVIEPFSGFEFVENKLHLIGPTDGRIPNGFWEIDYTGECDLGTYAVIYQKSMVGNKAFDYQFGFHELYSIEITDVNGKYSSYNAEKNPDSARIIYNHINKVADEKSAVVTLHYRIGLLCFDRLESPQKQSGFNSHLTQQIGGSTPKTLKYPYIRLHPQLFADMKKKHFLKKNDRLYVNHGSGTGYLYKTMKDILY